MANPEFSVLQRIRNGRRTFGITPRIPGGFITPANLAKFAEVAEKYKGTIKITSGQRIAILGLKEEDVDKAWADLGMDPGVRSAYSVKNVEICPAGFCKRMRQNTTFCVSFSDLLIRGASSVLSPCPYTSTAVSVQWFCVR